MDDAATPLSASPLTATCHCAGVSITFSSPVKPLVECQCSICGRYGAIWAHLQPEEVKITGETDFYIWGEKHIQFHRCTGCGCVTHWEPADKKAHKVVAVNCRMLDRAVLEKFEVRVTKGPPKKD